MHHHSVMMKLDLVGSIRFVIKESQSYAELIEWKRMFATEWKPRAPGREIHVFIATAEIKLVGVQEPASRWISDLYGLWNSSGWKWMGRGMMGDVKRPVIGRTDGGGWKVDGVHWLNQCQWPLLNSPKPFTCQSLRFAFVFFRLSPPHFFKDSLIVIFIFSSTRNAAWWCLRAIPLIRTKSAIPIRNWRFICEQSNIY